MSALGLNLFFSFATSCLFSLYIIPILCKLAVKFNIVDTPDGHIKNHEKSTPYLGGLGVYIGFIVGLSLVYPTANTVFSLLVGSTLLLFIGLIDDLVVMQPYQKFFGQMIAAICFLKGGLFLKDQFFHEYWFFGLPISFIWILTITNAFNLIDVMDGLASVTAICASVSFLIISLLLGYPGVALLLSSFIGALIGFFWYNKPVAQIYLGDAGSLFIGGFLSSIPFLIKWGTYNSWGFLVPAIILAIPLLEVVTLIVVRTYKGIPFYKGSPDHFSIYLRKHGWSKYQILLYVVLTSLVLFVLGYLFVFNTISIWGLILLGILGLAAWYWVLIYGKIL